MSRPPYFEVMTMRCRKCNQAFNGSDELCPYCGMVHTDESLISIPKPVQVKEVLPEIKKPEKKVVETKARRIKQ